MGRTLPQPLEGINPGDFGLQNREEASPGVESHCGCSTSLQQPQDTRPSPTCHSETPKHETQPQPEALSHQSGPLSPPSPAQQPPGRHCPCCPPSAPGPLLPGSLGVSPTPGLRCPSLLPSQGRTPSVGPGSGITPPPPRARSCLPQQLPPVALPEPWSVSFLAATGPGMHRVRGGEEKRVGLWLLWRLSNQTSQDV